MIKSLSSKQAPLSISPSRISSKQKSPQGKIKSSGGSFGLKQGNVKQSREQVRQHLGSAKSEQTILKGTTSVPQPRQSQSRTVLAKSSPNKSKSFMVIPGNKVISISNPETFIQRNDLFEKQKQMRLQNQRRKALYGIDPECKFQPVIDHKSNSSSAESSLLSNSSSKLIKIAEQDQLGVYQQKYYKKKGYSYRQKLLEKKTLQSKDKDLRKLMKESMKCFDEKMKNTDHDNHHPLSGGINRNVFKTKTTSQIFDGKKKQKLQTDHFEDRDEKSRIISGDVSDILEVSELDEDQTAEEKKNQYFTEISHVSFSEQEWSSVSECSFQPQGTSTQNQQAQIELSQKLLQNIGFSKKDAPLYITTTQQRSSVQYQELSSPNLADKQKLGREDEDPPKDQPQEEGDHFQDIIIKDDEVIPQTYIQSFAFSVIKHPEIRYEYLLQKIAEKNQKIKSGPSHCENGLQKEQQQAIQQQTKPEFQLLKLQKVELDDEGSEILQVIIDSEGNTIEKHYIEIKHFGLCHLMVVPEDDR